MKPVVCPVTLRSERRYGRKAPPGPIGAFLQVLPVAVSYATRMAFMGTSRMRGRRPEWLVAASDIRLVGYTGDEATVLQFEAPRLGEAAAPLYRENEFWPKPDRRDTAFDLLGDAIREVAAGNADSGKYDFWFLRQLVRFRQCLRGGYLDILLTGRRYTPDHPCVLDHSVILSAERLYKVTPVPRRVRVVGELDMVRASTHGFALKVDSGDEVKGVLLRGDITELARLLKSRVVVLGTAVFRPSGQLLRIDADEVLQASGKERFFSTVPKPTPDKLDVGRIVRQQRHKRGVAAVLGKWPGDETDEQVEQALAELS